GWGLGDHDESLRQGGAGGSALQSRHRRHRRGLAARKRDQLVAARSHGHVARRGSGALQVFGPGRGFGRRALDRQYGDRGGGASRCALGCALRPLPLSRRGHGEKAPVSDAPRLRRPRGAKMTASRTGAERAPACALVIFGATGDLTRRLLVPALRNLKRDSLLPEDFALIGIASRDLGDNRFRQDLREAMQHFKPSGGDDIDWFVKRAYYLGGKF